jgi:hypothetical protein
MTHKQLFKIIPAKQFFTKFCPDVRNYYHKSRGTDGNGKPITFSDQDNIQIKKGIERLSNWLTKF